MESDQRQIVIVGGGLAGIAAAESLVRNGQGKLNVLLLESKRTLGGRAGSFDDSVTGETVDYCQHVAMGCCTNYMMLMHRCSLQSFFRRFEDLTFLHPDVAPSRFAPSRYLPAPLHLARTVGSLSYLTWAQQREIRRGLAYLLRTPSSQMKKLSAMEWLKQRGQSNESIRLFWDVILVSALGEKTEYASMSVARKVIVDGFAKAKGASDVIVPRIPLRVLIGQQLRQSIEALGVVVRTRTPVQRIESVGEQRVAIRLRENDELLQADYCVAAPPWYTIEKLIDNKFASKIPGFHQIASFPSSPITGVHLWFDREITALPHAVMVGTAAQWLFRQPFDESLVSAPSWSLPNGGQKTGEFGRETMPLQVRNNYYYQVVMSSRHKYAELGREELVEQLLRELRHAFPQARLANLLHSRVVTDPNAVFSIRPEVDAARPPTLPYPALPCLLLAGDWTQTDWPSTMEGAVISGMKAAAEILKREGLSYTKVDPGLDPGWLSRALIAD